MKFSCQKNELVQALQIAGKALSNKPQMPILSGIYISAEEKQIEIQATDYEMGTIIRIDADIEEEGKIVLAGRYLQEVVRRMPGDKINLKSNRDENTTIISSNTATFKLLNMEANDFPVLKQLQGNTCFTIKNNILADIINKTVFSCANDESRPVFTGCLLEIIEDNINMVATNTHRLSLKQENLENNPGNIGIIIPAKALNELSRLLISDIPENVIVNCSHNQISFTFDNVYLMSRLIEGNFPDYHRVIPESFQTRVTLQTEEFFMAVDRVSLISRVGDYNIVRLEFGGGQVLISSNNPEIGKAEETVSAVIDGPDVNIAFNAKYIIDVLKNIDSEKFYFSLNESLNPAAIRQENDDSFTYIVTPVRTTN